jgi:hypothetical protein
MILIMNFPNNLENSKIQYEMFYSTIVENAVQFVLSSLSSVQLETS